jgi:hypothetical protein
MNTKKPFFSLVEKFISDIKTLSRSPDHNPSRRQGAESATRAVRQNGTAADQKDCRHRGNHQKEFPYRRLQLRKM